MALLNSTIFWQRSVYGDREAQVRESGPGAPRFETELFAGLLQETHHRFDSQLEVFQAKLLVGGVDVVVGEAEAHHDAGNAQMAVKVADDGDGAAGADEDRLLAPDYAQGGGGSLNVGDRKSTR